MKLSDCDVSKKVWYNTQIRTETEDLFGKHFENVIFYETGHKMWIREVLRARELLKGEFLNEIAILRS